MSLFAAIRALAEVARADDDSEEIASDEEISLRLAACERCPHSHRPSRVFERAGAIFGRVGLAVAPQGRAEIAAGTDRVCGICGCSCGFLSLLKEHPPEEVRRSPECWIPARHDPFDLGEARGTGDGGGLDSGPSPGSLPSNPC